MINPQGGGFPNGKFRFSRNEAPTRVLTEPAEGSTKKRRESIDLAFQARREVPKDFQFSRKGQNSANEDSPELKGKSGWAGKLESMKQKQFEFMHKIK